MLINELNQNIPQKAYATRAQSQHLANELKKEFPQADIKVEKKAVSPVHYLRILRSDINQITDFFKNRVGLDSLPLTQEQLGVTGKYQKSMLSYEAIRYLIQKILGIDAKEILDQDQRYVQDYLGFSISKLQPCAK